VALVEVSTFLPLPPEQVWDLVRRPATLERVSAPLLRFTPRDGSLPPQWQVGEYQMGVKLFGLVPLDDQIVGIEYPTHAGPGFALRDNGRACTRDGGPGGLIRRWDHLMLVMPEGHGTRYTDRVEVEAGAFTGAAALFARTLYRHRQKRWRRLATR
jgi:ligand-binding SRPBCC domain-containing protein